jgi:hypothetical protein
MYPFQRTDTAEYGENWTTSDQSASRVSLFQAPSQLDLPTLFVMPTGTLWNDL